MTPRTREALERMAAQEASPHEAEIARMKLDAAGSGARLPPHRPPSTAVPDPFDWGSWVGNSSTSSTSSVSAGVWVVGTIRVELGF